MTGFSSGFGSKTVSGSSTARIAWQALRAFLPEPSLTFNKARSCSKGVALFRIPDDQATTKWLAVGIEMLGLAVDAIGRRAQRVKPPAPGSHRPASIMACCSSVALAASVKGSVRAMPTW